MASSSLTRGGDSIESEKLSLQEGTTEAELWLQKIAKAKADEEDWREDACDAIAVYESEDDDAKNYNPTTFNLFHSNVETLVPALYNSTPIPDVRRRFGDPDPVAKQVVDITERAISFAIDQFDLDGEMKAVLKDGETAGRGLLRFRYKAQVQGQRVTGQSCEAERVPWDRFIRGPGRSWARMLWCAFEHQLTRDELIELNAKLGKTVGLDSAHDDKDQDKTDLGVMKTARVYEVWDKRKRRVLFIAENEKEAVLKELPDPLGLPDFWPVVKPYQPLQRVSSQVPLNPYKIYRRLLEELDDISRRIAMVTRQCRVRGLVDSAMEADLALLETARDGEYVPSKNTTAWAQGAGGLENAVAHWPLDPSVKLLAQLYINRESIKQTIYEVTGLSDILRGATDARETLGAQQIKTQWGSLRIQNRQAEAARLARDLFRMKAAVLAQPRFYSDQQISQITGLPQTKEQRQIWPQALQLLRSGLMQFRVDIETNSTIRGDLTRNQEQMNLFMQATSAFATAMPNLLQLGPSVIPAAVEVFTAFARNFKLGKQAEDALDKLQQDAPALAQQMASKPDPEAARAKVEAETAQRQAQMDGQKIAAQQMTSKMEAETKQRLAELDMRMKQQDAAHKERMAELEYQLKLLDLQIASTKGELEMQGRADELASKSVGGVIDFEAKRRGASLDEERKRADVRHAGELHQVKKRAVEGKDKPKPKGSQTKVVKLLRGKDGKITGGSVKSGDRETVVRLEG